MSVMELHEKLVALLERKGVKPATLARRAGVSKPAVSAWVHGESKPNLEAALAISRVFDVDMAWLADDKAGWPPPSQPDDEAEILRTAKRIGYKRAMNRLLAMPDTMEQERPAPRVEKPDELPTAPAKPKRKPHR